MPRKDSPEYAMQCKCGSQLFYESTRVMGVVIRLVDQSGKIQDTDLDRLGYGPTPKTVKCVDCGRRNPNPRAGNDGG